MRGLLETDAGEDRAALILGAFDDSLRDRDVVVIAQKIVFKAEAGSSRRRSMTQAVSLAREMGAVALERRALKGLLRLRDDAGGRDRGREESRDHRIHLIGHFDCVEVTRSDGLSRYKLRAASGVLGETVLERGDHGALGIRGHIVETHSLRGTSSANPTNEPMNWRIAWGYAELRSGSMTDRNPSMRPGGATTGESRRRRR